MSNWDKERLLRSSILAGFAAALVAGAPAMAQQADDEDDGVALTEEEEEQVSAGDRITITGSRIQRDEFSSVKPVHVLSGEVARDVGLFDAASVLQESTVATGLQIDTTFNGFVLDNGPGAQTIDLRGLGAARTLTLVNGRRIGASGVEGVPSVPDLNMIPNSLIDRYDVLLDGASSIYGSDAVAGVVNAILRKDFEGFEAEVSYVLPEVSGGDTQQYSALWGTTSDRGFVGFAAEYTREDNITLDDREIFGDCTTNVEETLDGRVLTGNRALARSLPAGSTPTDCTTAFGVNRIFADPLPSEAFFWGSLYYTPGRSNIDELTGIEIANFSELNLFGSDFYLEQFFAGGAPSPFSGTDPDVDASSPFFQSNGQPQERQRDVRAFTETVSTYSYGEYEIGGPVNAAAYFEAGMTNRRTRLQGEGSDGLFAVLPSDNPFNPCNPAATGVQGADCGLAFDIAVQALFGGSRLSDFGFPNPQQGARPVEVQVRVNNQGEDDTTEVDVTQYRLVGGLRGDLPIGNNWTWDISASYDRSYGSARRVIFDDESLALSLATTIEDPNNPGEFICGLDVDGDGVPDPGQAFPLGASNAAPDCVPVNLLAPSLYQTGGGEFATQAEYDYLRSIRTFDTLVEQTLVSAVFTGDLFELPAGTVAGVVGFEYRQDSIDSQPDDVARTGSGFGFFSDRGATGRRDLYEAFYELEIPLVAGEPLVEELTLNTSGRFTEETEFGEAFTYSINGVYRPTNYLTFRAGYGTSYRAPNLREQFIEGQSGFLGLTDPCVVPESAVGGGGVGVYDPTGDTRDQIVLDNCTAAGVDPTQLGIGGSAVRSVEVFTFKGSQLNEETSTSWNAGVVLEQPWFDFFDLQFAATYYDINVEDTLVELSPTFALDECYSQVPNQQSPLCSLIRRDALGFLFEIDTPFVNQDEEIVQGIDFNVVAGYDLTVFERELSLGLDARVNNTLERVSVINAPGATPFEDDFLGEPYAPEWNGTFRFFGDYEDFRVTWNTRWIGATEGSSPDAFGANDTCDGVGSGAPAPFNTDCRDVYTIDDYFVHDLTVRYAADTWSLVVGVNNVLGDDPQLVDTDEVFTVNGTNVPFGQDFVGRRVFASLEKRF